MLIGYARVSSTGQSLTVQMDALKAAGCDKVYAEKRSGRTAADRPELARALDQLRPADQLIVTRLDRLARSVGRPAPHRRADQRVRRGFPLPSAGRRRHHQQHRQTHARDPRCCRRV